MIGDLFARELRVINCGLEGFAQKLTLLGVTVISVFLFLTIARSPLSRV